jgi:type II secretory pathway component PulJ
MTRFLRERLRRDEAGVTIVEVTLTMLILAVILTIAFDFLDRTTLIANRTDAQAHAEDDTQRALRTVTQHVRGAFPITGPCTAATDSATPSLPAGYDNCVRFSVPRGVSGIGACARTELVVALVGTGSEKELVYNRQEFTGTTTCTAGTLSLRNVLLSRVVNTASEPLFTYYGSDGNAISTSTAAAAVPAAATVKVDLRVIFRTGSNPIALNSSAALRNNITR